MHFVVQLVCLCVPPMAAAYYHKALFTDKLDLHCASSVFVTAAGYLFAIIIIMAGVGVLRGHVTVPFENLLSTMSNVFKYGIITSVLALLLPNLVFCGYSCICKVRPIKSKEKEQRDET